MPELHPDRVPSILYRHARALAQEAAATVARPQPDYVCGFRVQLPAPLHPTDTQQDFYTQAVEAARRRRPASQSGVAILPEALAEMIDRHGDGIQTTLLNAASAVATASPAMQSRLLQRASQLALEESQHFDAARQRLQHFIDTLRLGPGESDSALETYVGSADALGNAVQELLAHGLHFQSLDLVANSQPDGTVLLEGVLHARCMYRAFPFRTFAHLPVFGEA